MKLTCGAGMMSSILDTNMQYVMDEMKRDGNRVHLGVMQGAVKEIVKLREEVERLEKEVKVMKLLTLPVPIDG
jgi:archaellum component FlaC